MTYYIDPVSGDDSNDGLAPSRAWRTHAGRSLIGGDTVLFKRGSVIRGPLQTCNGTPNAPITFGAYGEGDKPAFLGSIPTGDPDLWTEEASTIWRFTGSLESEVCNLVFDNGESCGNMRWQPTDLRNQGEWHYTGIGKSNETSRFADSDTLTVCSKVNPAAAYSDIECVLWGGRKLVTGDRHIVLENLSFRNSGVHGYWCIGAEHITIRGCEFRFIGGAVWDRKQRIRFGNAIEFWDGAHDVLVEGCVFDNIYDSGVTHQGGRTENIPERLHFRNNHFSNCGMSAYECREPSRDVYFEHNTSVNAGGGFSMQGEQPPRQSEIHPQPMGHHVFIWRIDPNTQPGAVTIRNNTFSEAPYGSAIYSIIDPADEAKFVLDHNQYHQTTGEHLIHWGGKSYRPDEFARYQAESGQDEHSEVSNPIGSTGAAR